MNSPPASPTPASSSITQKPEHSTLLLTTLESTLTATLTHTSTLENLTQQLRALRETLQSLGGLHLLAQTARNKYLESLRRDAGLTYSRLLTNIGGGGGGGGLDQEFGGGQGGDAVADALLYRDGIRDDEEFFILVYGVEWGKVLEFRHNQELIQAISHRADVFSRGQGFTAEFNITFEQLITWAATATGHGPPAVLLLLSEDNEALSWFTHIMSS
ncbi:hypothetical protein B9Z19DRAFT_1111160 [Tuber borchii]|uniref:Uncharacterized protein n=1 Tax=Tuber borchii TaxID=42251 RepID=A0A2T6ZDG2_TUBBO|nr:hypothetical protein B9Z19DRAFT_1111160 [Tuber borchii]